VRTRWWAPSGNECRLRRIDVDAAREVLPVPEEDRRAERRVVLVLIQHFGQPHTRGRIETILDERSIESDEDDIVAAFDGDRHAVAEWNVREPRGVFRSLRLVLLAERAFDLFNTPL